MPEVQLFIKPTTTTPHTHDTSQDTTQPHKAQKRSKAKSKAQQAITTQLVSPMSPGNRGRSSSSGLFRVLAPALSRRSWAPLRSLPGLFWDPYQLRQIMPYVLCRATERYVSVYLCITCFICVYIFVYIYIFIYVKIYRERGKKASGRQKERERERDVSVCTYTYTCTYAIQFKRERARDWERQIVNKGYEPRYTHDL